MACVTHRLDNSCIIFLCSDPGSADDLFADELGGFTLSTFNGPSGSKSAANSELMCLTGGEAIDQLKR
jgi:hypothetical protein